MPVQIEAAVPMNGTQMYAWLG